MNKSLIYRGVPQEIKLDESVAHEPKLPKQIQLFKTGTYHDPRYGKFSITPDMLLAMKKNFDSKVRGIDIAVDFAHESDKNAAAWIKDIELTDGNTKMFATVEWTGSGTKALADKEFRYISPDFTNNFTHNETKKEFGPTLNGAALTNRPVIKGMEPVILSELEQTENKETGGKMDPKDEQIAALQKECEELKAKLAGKAGEDDAAKLAAMAKELEEYKAKEAKAIEEKKLSEQKTAFDKMLSEGKVVEAQRKPYMDGDLKAFTDLAQPLKLSEVGHGGEGDGKEKNKDLEGKTTQEQVVILAEAKRKEKKDLSVGESIRLVLSENKELATKYYENK